MGVSQAEPRIKRPAFQWYPGDNRRDLGVQACCFEARALWREMLDLMHDGEPYGHLTAGGAPITPGTLARLVGKSPSVVAKWLKELEAHGVFSRTEAGVIYSRRMVRDEQLRTVRAAAGSKGGSSGKQRPEQNAEQTAEQTTEQTGKQNAEQTEKQKAPPAVATATASAFASALPVAVGDYALRCTIRANQGLSEHATRPQPIARIIATNGSSFEAAEQMQSAGVPLEFAEGEVYRLARAHKAEGYVSTLNYFAPGVVRAWQRQTATAQAGDASRPATAPVVDPINAALDEFVRRKNAEKAAVAHA